MKRDQWIFRALGKEIAEACEGKISELKARIDDLEGREKNLYEAIKATGKKLSELPSFLEEANVISQDLFNIRSFLREYQKWAKACGDNDVHCFELDHQDWNFFFGPTPTL